MPDGMDVKRHGMSLHQARSANVRLVGRKKDGDRAVEDRIRAYIREGMIRNRWGVTTAADSLESDQGNLTKILQGSRGISAGLAARVSSVFRIDPLRMFTVDPPREYFEYFVPKGGLNFPLDEPAAPQPQRPPSRRKP